MITDERLKELMRQVGMPDSISLYQALRQCDMEATLAERERLARMAESRTDGWHSLTAAEIRAGRIEA